MKTFQTSHHYTAYVHPKAGLIIQSTRLSGPKDWPVNKGIVIRPDHPQFAEWLDAFETAIDTDEASALCKALLKGN
jgi:hypothetical protein